MPSHDCRQRAHRRRWGTHATAWIAALLVCAAIATGCAVPGEPTARHPVIPEPVRDLTVRQQGNEVILSFTPPKTNTDQKQLTALPTAEVYRTAPLTPGVTPPKIAPHLADIVPSTVVETHAKNGHVELPDELDPATLASQGGQQLTYVVRTRISAKRASADSNAASVIVFPPPSPVGELHATRKGRRYRPGVERTRPDAKVAAGNRLSRVSH